MSGNSVLKVSELTKIFSGGFSWRLKRNEPTLAVDHISFAIREGEIVGLLGSNGAGKTTTIQMLLGTTEKTSGEISYFGKSFAKQRSEVLQYVNYASAYTRLPWRMTVYENLMVYAKMYQVEKPKKRIDLLLEQFEMSEYVNKTVSSLSAGQSTRIILAKAFINFPRLLLLDEPTASLDPDIALGVRAFLIKQQRKHGVAMLLTSHNMAEVAEVCDRVIFLRQGKIFSEDTPEGLAKTIRNCTLRLWVGDGLKRLQAYACDRGYKVTVADREAVLVINEEEVAAFLALLAKQNIAYSKISIDKPTLEDYFLAVSGGGR